MADFEKGDRVVTRHNGKAGTVIRLCKYTAFVKFDEADKWGHDIASHSYSNLILEDDVPNDWDDARAECYAKNWNYQDCTNKKCVGFKQCYEKASNEDVPQPQYPEGDEQDYDPFPDDSNDYEGEPPVRLDDPILPPENICPRTKEVCTAPEGGCNYADDFWACELRVEEQIAQAEAYAHRRNIEDYIDGGA